MSQSVARNLVHLVFSTKHREPLIVGDLYPALFGYLVRAADGINCRAVAAGGVADHVHILFALHKTVALCKAVEEIKKESSKWAKENGGPANFYWQNGYGAFSVSPPHADRWWSTSGGSLSTTPTVRFRTSSAGCCTSPARSATSARCGIERRNLSRCVARRAEVTQGVAPG